VPSADLTACVLPADLSAQHAPLTQRDQAPAAFACVPLHLVSELFHAPGLLACPGCWRFSISVPRAVSYSSGDIRRVLHEPVISNPASSRQPASSGSISARSSSPSSP